MNTHGTYDGIDSGSYPEVASRAVRGVSQQNPSPAYGYLRSPMDGISHQKIYLFRSPEEAQSWFTGVTHAPGQLYDYAAVFVATDLSRPVPGLENFGHTAVSGAPHVGDLWPFLLGFPLGALGGYAYRGWQEGHPGQWIPGISGVPGIGGPWLNIESYGVPYLGGPWLDLTGPQVGGPWLDLTGPQVGGPWLDVVGAEPDLRERRRAWQQVRALIELAKREATNAQAMAPAVAWVWSLEPTPGPGGQLSDTQLVPFASLEQAEDYITARFHTPHVALALFDPSATRHWPNPVRWTKSDDPAYMPLIAQRAAQYNPSRVAGVGVGALPRTAAIDAALEEVRTRAQGLASRRAGNVVGVIYTTGDRLWHALAFHDEDAADDWLETATKDPGAYTYAAYYDKNDATWPEAVIDKIGGFRVPRSARAGRSQRALVGGVLDDIRAHAKALATAQRGNAVGVVHLVNGSWSTKVFPDLDAAIDWLSEWTGRRGSFTYAGAFEKDAEGTAYVQQEEFGAQPMQRSLATTRGESMGWAA